MFNLIAVENYSYYYFNILMIVVIISFIHTLVLDLEDQKAVRITKIGGFLLLVFIIVYMGVRPISGRYFGDMGRYARSFESFAKGQNIMKGDDILFAYFTKFCAMIMTVEMFFVICAFLYVYPLYLVSVRFFKKYWFYSFLMLALSFTFWGAGVNGMRNGLAATLFLFAISRKNKYHIYAWFLVSLLIHKSLIIPVAAYFLAANYKNTKMYIRIWILCIPLSLAVGSVFEQFFLSVGFGEEDRLQGYLTEIDEGIANSKTGFRWDFLLYSSIGVFSGWYFIVKKKFNDPIYIQMVNVYITVNAFWVLIIKANFSNRFAYLSWFMLSLIIIYPLLKVKFSNKQHRLIGQIFVLYYFFTYTLNVILAK